MLFYNHYFMEEVCTLIMMSFIFNLKTQRLSHCHLYHHVFVFQYQYLYFWHEITTVPDSRCIITMVIAPLQIVTKNKYVLNNMTYKQRFVIRANQSLQNIHIKVTSKLRNIRNDSMSGVDHK